MKREGLRRALIQWQTLGSTVKRRRVTSLYILFLFQDIQREKERERENDREREFHLFIIYSFKRYIYIDS